VRAPAKLFLASGNQAKLAEFRAIAQESRLAEVEPLPEFASWPAFEEDAPTFAENAIGKALYYSRLHEGLVFADDSGLVVPALGGEPGVHSARYTGPHATNAQRIAKLLDQLQGKTGAACAAHFVCAIALAEHGRAIAVVTDSAHGEILESARGQHGFGYDPLFYFPALQETFAEMSAEKKNQHSHRGKAFRRLLATLAHPAV
jgi:XTP/dITP diphosphohydrolase